MPIRIRRSVSNLNPRPSRTIRIKLKRRGNVGGKKGRTISVPIPKRADPRLKGVLDAIEKHELIASLARASFYDFVKIFWKSVVAEEFQDNWHIEYICNEMQKCAERVFKSEDKEYDEVFNVPPGSSKSTICSIMFPAWVWTRMPSARFICCSYAEKLALTLSRKCRDVIKSELYKQCFPEIQFRADQDTKGMFANVNGGERYAVGSSGFVMGNHAHFIIIDDPVDPEAVLSDAELERINNWIKEQLSGRKVNRQVSVTFLIMQRLHQDDPTARMIKQKKVKHVKLPATDEFEVKPPGLRKYYREGLLDPKRLPITALNEIRHGDRGEYVFSGQYGQEPVPPGGGMFKVNRICKLDPRIPLPKMKCLVRYWDKAASNQKGAYTVGVLMGLSSPPQNEHLLKRGMVKISGMRDTPKGFSKKALKLQKRLATQAHEVLTPQNGTKQGKNNAKGIAAPPPVNPLLSPQQQRRYSNPNLKGELPLDFSSMPKGSAYAINPNNLKEKGEKRSEKPSNNLKEKPSKCSADLDNNSKPKYRTSDIRDHVTRSSISGGRSRLFILDVVRVQLDSWQRERLIKQTAAEDGRHVIVGIEQEGAGGGKESAENTTAMLMGYKVKVIKPVGRKEIRAEPYSVQVNAGNVYIVDGPWVEEYLSELKHFPFSTYKDQVDASAGAFSCLIKGHRRVGGMRRRANNP